MAMLNNQRVIVWLKHDQERNWGNHIPVHLEGPNRIRSQTNAHLIGARHEHSLYFQATLMKLLDT